VSTCNPVDRYSLEHFDVKFLTEGANMDKQGGGKAGCGELLRQIQTSATKQKRYFK
jgi:hypothetical protein